MRAGWLTLLLSFSAAAAPFSWTGGAGSGRWEDAGNWAGGSVPPDDGTADVTIGVAATVALDGVRVISTLSVSAAADVTLQAGSQPQAALVLRGAGLFRSARGRLIAQVPVIGDGALQMTGFEAQGSISTATVFDLQNGLWNGATAVSQAIVRASGAALPASTALSLGAGSVLDMNGQVVSIGSLSGSGTIINAAATKATLFVGSDGSSTTFTGALGGTIAGQTANGFVDIAKLGAGTLTTTGQLTVGGSSFGLVRVLDGALVVNGSVTGFMPVVVIEASSARHGTLWGTGSVPGYLWTANNDVAGATVSPGQPGSKGILHATNCDLRHGTLAIRFSAYGIAGVDFDQLDCSAGYLSFDADSDVVIDLGGTTATGGPIPIALYGTGNGPIALQSSQIHLINNPAGLVPTLTSGNTSLNLSIKSPNPASTSLFNLTPGHGLVTSESGRAATFTVALGKAPSANVTVPIASSNTAEGVAAPASLTFTSQSWATPQTVTVSGVDDAVPDGNVSYQVNVGPAVSADATYSGKSAPAVTAVNLDDDLITVSPVSGLVSQPFAPAQFTVTFHAPVSGSQNVWLQFASSDPAIAGPSPALDHLNVTNVTPPPQTMTLAGGHQLVAGCTPYRVSAYAVLSGDARYNGFELPDVSACHQRDRAPVASNAAFAASQGAPLSIAGPGLLLQAYDPDGDAITAQMIGAPAHGTATVNPDGSFTYTSSAGYAGPDSFTWAASDGVLLSAPATVALTVAGQPPTAAADRYLAQTSTPLSVAAPGVLANDSGGTLTAALATGPAHGTLVLAADGSFTYKPAPAFTGSDTFTYTAANAAGISSPALVTITVRSTNTAPDAAADAYSAQAGVTLDVPAPGVLANDVDPDGDPITAVLMGASQHGTLTLRADGSFTYVPDSGFTGTDSFTYAASDGLLSSPATAVSIDVGAQAGFEAATLALTAGGGDLPGATRTLWAQIPNTGTFALTGATLLLGPGGMSLVGATDGNAAALTLDAGAVLLPDLAVGAATQIAVTGQLTATPGSQAGASVTLQSAAGNRLGTPQASWVSVSRLNLDAGGCGCHSGNPGGALAWIGALLFAARRRRSALPGRADPDLGDRLIARDLRLGGLAAAERVDGDHRDPLRPVVEADVGVELAGGRHLDGLALHVDAAARGDAARERDRGAVRLVAGPLHREQHLLQGRGGLLERAVALHARHLPVVELDGLPGRTHVDGAAGGGDDHGLSLGGEQEVTAFAVRDRIAVLDLQRDAALAALDVGLDASAHAAAQHAGGRGGEADLAAIVELDADAVDRQLGLAVLGRAQAVADADALALRRRTPWACAALELDGAATADQDRAAFRGRRRSLRVEAGHGSGSRSLFVAAARRRERDDRDRECCRGALPVPYMGVVAGPAMPPGGAE